MKILCSIETVLKSMNHSLQTSNTLAISAKKSIDESFVILSRITQTRNELMDAMEDTEDTIGFIAERGSEDKSLMEVVDGMGDVAYEVSCSTVVETYLHFRALCPVTFVLIMFTR